MTQNTLDIGGRAIPYIEEGDGPVSLVLLTRPDRDGLGVVAHYLDEEAGFRVVRIGAAGPDSSREDRVADALAVIDHLGLARTWIGGWGAGGTLARAFAAQHADRVNGLLVLGVEDEDIPLVPVVPVLVIQAAGDDVTPPANAEPLRAQAPERVSVKTIDGADHLFPATHPVETAVIIEEYLDWD